MVIGHYASSSKYETEAFIAADDLREHQTTVVVPLPAVTRRAGELLSARDLAIISIYRLDSGP